MADGGWFPLVVAAVIFTVLTTWATGRALMRERLEEEALPLDVFIKSAAHPCTGCAGPRSSCRPRPDAVPSALLHNLKHNQVLHERVLILNVKVEDVPHVAAGEAAGGRMTPARASIGSSCTTASWTRSTCPRDLVRIKTCGGGFDMMSTSFFLGRQKLIATKEQPGMALWRERLFAWMMKSSESAMEHYLSLDVRDERDWEKSRAWVEEHWGGLDLLFNNAGVAAGGRIEVLDLEDWQWIIDINLLGVVRGCRTFVPMFKQQRHGRIVNTASMAGLGTRPR